MKKFLVLLSLILCVSINAQAELTAKVLPLKDSNGTAIDDLSLSNGVVVYSKYINVEDNGGFTSLLLTENKSGGAGDVDVSVEYSTDKTNWYEAYTTTAGTLSQEETVVTAFGNKTRWIVHPARIAKYMRYKFDPDADSQITATIIFQRDH